MEKNINQETITTTNITNNNLLTSKEKFIDYIIAENSLKFGEFTLKSKRSSPYFFNVGDLNDGLSISKLGDAFAETILEMKTLPQVIFGPSYKGIPLSVATSISLSTRGKVIAYCFDRKEEKNYGEGTGVSSADLQKKILVGAELKDNSNIVIVEDVFTTGKTKYETIELLNKLAKNITINAILIAFDRQEVGEDGKSSVKEFTEKTGIPVFSIISISDALEYMRKQNNKYEKEITRIENYLRVYGNDEVRKTLPPLNQKVIDIDKSVIPACDFTSLEDFEELVKQTHEIPGIGGYKIGFELGLNNGFKEIVKVAKKYTTKPLIYDHQKAATDIPDTGKNFANVCKSNGIDSIILFPQAGPETERAWIYHALNYELKVLVGGYMTHPTYTVNEGGFISDDGALEIYKIAARAGITNFVVPGNKLDIIEKVKKTIEIEGISPIFYSPGFIAQGGKISDASKLTNGKFHGIIGRGITLSNDKAKAAKEFTSQL